MASFKNDNVANILYSAIYDLSPQYVSVQAVLMQEIWMQSVNS